MIMRVRGDFSRDAPWLAGGVCFLGCGSLAPAQVSQLLDTCAGATQPRSHEWRRTSHPVNTRRRNCRRQRTGYRRPTSPRALFDCGGGDCRAPLRRRRCQKGRKRACPNAPSPPREPHGMPGARRLTRTRNRRILSEPIRDPRAAVAYRSAGRGSLFWGTTIMSKSAYQVAVLIDAGFFLHESHAPLGHRLVEPEEVIDAARSTLRKNEHLFRIYYYDCPPFEGTRNNPVDQRVVNFAATDTARARQSLHGRLEVAPPGRSGDHRHRVAQRLIAPSRPLRRASANADRARILACTTCAGATHRSPSTLANKDAVPASRPNPNRWPAPYPIRGAGVRSAREQANRTA